MTPSIHEQLLEKIDRLTRELEVERMRLAACGIAAHGAGDVHFENMLPAYDSDALIATRALVKERDALKALKAKFDQMSQATFYDY